MQRFQVDNTDAIKESNTRASNTYGFNSLEYSKPEQLKTNSKCNLNTQSNKVNHNTSNNKEEGSKEKEDEDKKKSRAERKRSTIAEFHHIKIPTNQNDDIVAEENIDNNNSNSNNIKKDLFSASENNNIKYTHLDLEVINSWNLPKGLRLHINKDRLENSLRNENDGKIFFGFQKDINVLNEKPYIDYLLQPKDNDYDNKFIGIHFEIRYDENNSKYFIRDLGSGYGTFIKLVAPIKIKNNLLINIGDTFIVFSFKENGDNKDNLILKIFTGNEQSEIYEFNNDKKTITIGRDVKSDVYIEDKLLSRKHCYIYRGKNEGAKNNEEEKESWYIKDGDLNGKKSTNDTWLYSLEDTLIYDQMIFKTNHNLFKCICS